MFSLGSLKIITDAPWIGAFLMYTLAIALKRISMKDRKPSRVVVAVPCVARGTQFEKLSVHSLDEFACLASSTFLVDEVELDYLDDKKVAKFVAQIFNSAGMTLRKNLTKNEAMAVSIAEKIRDSSSEMHEAVRAAIFDLVDPVPYKTSMVDRVQSYSHELAAGELHQDNVLAEAFKRFRRPKIKTPEEFFAV